MISIYKNTFDTTNTDTIDIDIFLENIKNGHYANHVINVRTAKTDEERRKAKQHSPVVAISGTFSQKKDAGLIQHSGFICIDIDNVDPADTKGIICADDYVYAAFESIGGNGLAVIIQIDGKRHREAFLAIAEYFANTYGVVCDHSCINVSRGRYISHDPNIYINTKAKKWVAYQPKTETTKVKETKVIFVKTDFDDIINQICSRRLDIAGNYHGWVNIGFAIASKFDEAGREYFRAISQYRNGDQAKNERLIDRQYDACLKSERSGKTGVTIASLYYLAKQAGIETYSSQTKEIIKIASSQKRSAGMDDNAIRENMKQHTDFDHDTIDEVVPQVGKDTFVEDLSIIDIVCDEVRMVYQVRRNVISRQLEINDNGKWHNVDDIYLNTMFLNLKRNITKLTSELFDKILFSKMTYEYNPFLDFIDRNKDLKPTGNIRRLSDCITSDFGLSGADREHFIRKWLVGVISSIHGEHSPLMLVLTGEKQGTGKTQFFRRLLPVELRHYHADSKLDMDKDAEILMTKKLIILDDELAGKSKRENTRLKELTSKQTFSIREPYGRVSVDLNRIAVLAGTSNENGVLSDPTGNRRVIPIHVSNIDHNAYNAIDKTHLFMEAYWLWVNGETHEFTAEDIAKLKSNTDYNFEEVMPAEEAILSWFTIPVSWRDGNYYTSTEIASHIERNGSVRITPKAVGQALQKLGMKRQFFKIDGKGAMGYKLIKKMMADNDFREGVDDVLSADTTAHADDYIPFNFEAPF